MLTIPITIADIDLLQASGRPGGLQYLMFQRIEEALDANPWCRLAVEDGMRYEMLERYHPTSAIRELELVFPDEIEDYVEVWRALEAAKNPTLGAQSVKPGISSLGPKTPTAPQGPTQRVPPGTLYGIDLPSFRLPTPAPPREPPHLTHMRAHQQELLRARRMDEAERQHQRIQEAQASEIRARYRAMDFDPLHNTPWRNR